MNSKILLIFVKRILNSGSEAKASMSLYQLKTLLEGQNAPKDTIDLLEKIIRSIPEMKEAARNAVITVEDVKIADRRAQERKAWEEAARHYGRC